MPSNEGLNESMQRLIGDSPVVVGWSLGVPKNPKFAPTVYHLIVRHPVQTLAYCKPFPPVGEVLKELPSDGVRCLACETRAFKSAKERTEKEKK